MSFFSLIKALVFPIRLYDMGGGGGGSAPAAAPTQQTVTNTNLPEYARPAMETLIGRGEALTDINQNPYTPYSGQRVADYSGLQNQAFQGLGGMQPSGLNSTAAGVATGVANAGAPSYNQNTQRFTDPGIASAYMNPYMRNVVDFQSAEARRQADISKVGEQQRAVGAGAFGGNREALMRSEIDRNLQNTLAGIAATGSANAYQSGQQAFMTDEARDLQSRQFGANLGLQGLQTRLQAANTMGQLGQQDFSQRLGINQAQQQAGLTQQQTEQQRLNAQYQTYADQLNYPYKQLGFMSDILRGVPGTQAAQSIYQAPPSTVSSLASLGLGAYGLSGLFGAQGKRAGGVVRMASGGPVSDAYVDKAARGGSPAIDPITAAWIARRRAMLRTAAAGAEDAEMVDGGLAAAPAPNMNFADGGIVGYDEEVPRYPIYGPATAEDRRRAREVYPSAARRAWDAFFTPAPIQISNYDIGDRDNASGMRRQAGATGSWGPPQVAAEKKPKRSGKQPAGIAAAADTYAGTDVMGSIAPPTRTVAREVVQQHAEAAQPRQARDFDYWLAKMQGEADEGLAALRAQSEKRAEERKARRGDDKYAVALQMSQAFAQPGQHGITAFGNAMGVAGQEGARLRQSYEQGDERAAENDLRLGLQQVQLQKANQAAALKATHDDRALAQADEKLGIERAEVANRRSYQDGVLAVQNRAVNEDRYKTDRTYALGVEQMRSRERIAAQQSKLYGKLSDVQQLRDRAVDNANNELKEVLKDPMLRIKLQDPAKLAALKQELELKHFKLLGIDYTGGGIGSALPQRLSLSAADFGEEM